MPAAADLQPRARCAAWRRVERMFDMQNIETLELKLWWARTMEMREAEKQLDELLKALVEN